MKLWLQYFSIHLRSTMQYKASFWLTTFGQALVTLISFASMYILFDRFGTIKGYTFNEVLLCFSTVYMAFALAEMVGRGFDSFSTIISNGEFDRMMVRPQSEIVQVLGSRLEFSRVGRLVQALAVYVYALMTCGVEWTALKLMTLVFMLIGGTAIFFGLFVIYAALCFFTTEGLEFINIFTDGGRDFAQYPFDIYPKWILRIFTYIVPLALVNYYPFLYIIGRGPTYYMWIPLGAVLFLVPCFTLWKIGVRHYKSTGS